MARLSCTILLLALVAQNSVLVSATRSLTEEGVDYDVEYAAVSPSGAVVPTVTNTTVSQNGTVVTTQSTYSANATVPAVKMAATLSAYTLDSFDSAEQARYISTLEESILASLKVVSNVTIDSIKAGSVVVSNTVAFTGADGAAAATSLSTALASNSNGGYVSTLFGSSFGSVTVDPASVSETTTTNPTKKSGVGATGLSLLAVAGTAAVLGLAQFGL